MFRDCFSVIKESYVTNLKLRIHYLILKEYTVFDVEVDSYDIFFSFTPKKNPLSATEQFHSIFNGMLGIIYGWYSICIENSHPI